MKVTNSYELKRELEIYVQIKPIELSGKPLELQVPKCNNSEDWVISSLVNEL